ncbi:MAG: hypothetical protein V4482_02175 [Pseudomonadota bacterium]
MFETPETASPPACPSDARYLKYRTYYGERAGFAEYEAGISRSEAEYNARLETLWVFIADEYPKILDIFNSTITNEEVTK